MPEAPPYLLLRAAQELYGRTPAALADDERRRAVAVARRQMAIETRILEAPEAAGVALPDVALDQSLSEIRGRYGSDAEFHADLARNGLGEAELADAIRRQLIVEAVLERVAGRSARVADTDVEIFYLMHRERFRRPERRTLRQILVTINDALPGSGRASARAKIDAIRARLSKSPERFAEQALKHSECPSALAGGELGAVPRGKLFPELESTAFALPVGALSDVVESPLGFHLLRCDAIDPERILRLDEVRETIRTHLLESRRRLCQKSWIAGLFRKAA